MSRVRFSSLLSSSILLHRDINILWDSDFICEDYYTISDSQKNGVSRYKVKGITDFYVQFTPNESNPMELLADYQIGDEEFQIRLNPSIYNKRPMSEYIMPDTRNSGYRPSTPMILKIGEDFFMCILLSIFRVGDANDGTGYKRIYRDYHFIKFLIPSDLNSNARRCEYFEGNISGIVSPILHTYHAFASHGIMKMCEEDFNNYVREHELYKQIDSISLAGLRREYNDWGTLDNVDVPNIYMMSKTFARKVSRELENYMIRNKLLSDSIEPVGDSIWKVLKYKYLRVPSYISSR